MYLKQRGEVLDNRAKHNKLQVKVVTVETAQVGRLRTIPPVHDESMPTEHESKNDLQFDPRPDLRWRQQREGEDNETAS